MQQFGFSATDVKLKQWDETQNSAATQTFSPEISSGTQMPSNYLPRHPLYHSPKQPSENTSFWEPLR